MTLQEVKLVLDWAKQRLDSTNGSRYSYPDEYKKKVEDYKVISDLYDSICKERIKQIREKNNSL